MAKITFLTRTDDDNDDHIAQGIASREHELAGYYANIESYTQQLATLTDIPDELPANLKNYLGKTNEQIIALGANQEDATIASEFNHRERIKLLLFTEQAECKKSELAYQALLLQLPEGSRRDAAIARHLAKKDS